MTRTTTVTRKAFTQQEAADMYGVSLATIKRARVAGDLVMHNIGSETSPGPPRRPSPHSLPASATRDAAGTRGGGRPHHDRRPTQT
jgi:hypothetical protein